MLNTERLTIVSIRVAQVQTLQVKVKLAICSANFYEEHGAYIMWILISEM